MKKIIVLLIVAAVSIFVQSINFLPWWSFLISVFILGIVLPLRKWSVQSFLFGFLAGFMSWVITTLFFEALYEGEIMNKVAEILSISYLVLLFIIGLIGGVITGLALYSGALLRNDKRVQLN